MKILLTGATGFIGSNIAKGLLERNYELYATYRENSSFDKCNQFVDKINWIKTDDHEWKRRIIAIGADQIIHAAWGGIESKDRNNWDIQINNFLLAKEFFDLAKKSGIKKIIALGSQAEYGSYSIAVKETMKANPTDSYGVFKTLSGNYLRSLFENSMTEWYWIRVFSVFGEGENPNWLLPMVISNLLKGEPIKLTLCEQKYNYLYIKNFVKQILTIVECKENKSGIYNICNSESIVLKDLLTKIADLIDAPYSLLQFGSIPYRPSQNMLIDGDNSKFSKSFVIEDNSFTDLTDELFNTIEYYKNKKN